MKREEYVIMPKNERKEKIREMKKRAKNGKRKNGINVKGKYSERNRRKETKKKKIIEEKIKYGKQKKIHKNKKK